MIEMSDKNLYFDTSEANNLGKMTIEPDSSVATPSNVKNSYVFKDANTREVLVGTMPINESENIKINPKSDYHSDNSYIIPKGYHDGTGKVYTGDLSEYTQGNAQPEHVANNKIFWVNGKKLVGTLDLDMNTQVGTATADDLVDGKTAWVNRTKITGTIPKLPRKDKTLLAGESYTYPYGLSPGTSVISAASLESQTTATAEADDILQGETAWVNGQKITGTFNLSNEIREFMSETNTTKSQVLEGQKFYSSTYGMIVSGSMPDHTGEGYSELGAGVTYSIPEGYYDGNSGIKVKSLSDMTLATAKANEIVYNKTAWANGEKLVGTMPSNDSTTVIIEAGDTYNIPTGYHTGNGKVKAKNLSDETLATAIASNILKDKTAWVNGEKLVGTMAINPSTSTELEPGNTYIIPEGYHTGSSSVYTKALSYYTPGTADSEEILYGETAWVNGTQVTGIMPNNTPETIRVDAGDTYTIPKGYHDGTGRVKANPLGEQTPGDAESLDILAPKTAWVNGYQITGSLELSGSAALDDVLAGQTFYNINAKQKLTGTLALTGTATEADVAEGVSFYSDNAKRKLIGSLSLSGDAEESKVLTGSTFYSNSVRNKLTGTMPNNGTVNVEVDAGETYTIPEGYHTGSGKVKAKDLSDQTSGTAVANDILKDKIAWVNGSKVTGTLALTGTATPENVLIGTTFYNTNPKQKIDGSMPNRGSMSRSLSAGGSFTIPEGYHDGTGIISAVGLPDQTSGTATDADILNNKTAWVNGVKLTGTIPIRDTVVVRNLLAGESVEIESGYYSTTGSITAETLENQTQATAASSDILSGKSAWVNGNKINGSITINSPISQTGVLAGTIVNIPAGYYSEIGHITTESLENQTRADAEVQDILYGKTAWVDGAKYTGTMPNNGNWSQADVAAGSSITIPLGYHDGTGTVTALDLASQTQATATADQILDPYTAWVNGQKLTGTIPTRNTRQIRLTAGSELEIPAGYYPNGITFYALYTDEVLDLTGTSAWWADEILHPEDSGYVDTEDSDTLVIVDDIIRTY